MIRAGVLAATAATMLAGSGAPARPAPDPKPGPALAQTFQTCRWGKVVGRTLSIWSYACGKDLAGMRLSAADRVGGFVLAVDGEAPREVIRTFAKPAGAPVSAILPAVLRATGPHKRSCRLVAYPRYGEWGAAWLLEPTGPEKAAYDKANQAEPQDNPCGELGIGPAGDRFFRLLPGDPTRVIYADMGSEVQVYDLRTLRPAP